MPPPAPKGDPSPKGDPPPAEFVPAPGGLRRLTVSQYFNSIANLFGPNVKPSIDAGALEVLPLNGFASIGAALLSVSRPATEQLESAALELARLAMADASRRTALLGCTPAGMVDDGCTRAFVKKFGRRAWRRPLTDEEVAAYVDLVTGLQKTTGDFYRGVEYGIAGLLQSPNFLYRVELGSPDPGHPSRLVFSDYELATRLSFFLWNSPPDDELLDAAEAQQLSKGTGFDPQVKRLSASPRSTEAMQEFFAEYYRLADLDRLPADPTLFPLRTPTIGASMREETQRFLTDIALTRNADYREMFDSRSTFVNGELAKIYGLPLTGPDFAATTLPDGGPRVGYLGQGSFLALNAHPNVTSPTYRGKFIQEMLLCVDIPPPPNNVPPLPEDTATAPRTMRQKLELHRQVEPCKSCHSVMDPLGLAMENFDAIGAYRTMDAGQVIDASGALIIDGKSVPFSGPRELATVIKNHPALGPCVAKNIYRFALGHTESDGEGPAIASLSASFSGSGFKFRSLVEGVVRNPGFIYAAPAP